MAVQLLHPEGLLQGVRLQAGVRLQVGVDRPEEGHPEDHPEQEVVADHQEVVADAARLREDHQPHRRDRAHQQAHRRECPQEQTPAVLLGRKDPPEELGGDLPLEGPQEAFPVALLLEASHHAVGLLLQRPHLRVPLRHQQEHLCKRLHRQVHQPPQSLVV